MSTVTAARSRRVLVVLCGVQAALVAAQATLAGHVLSGNAPVLAAHEIIGTSVITWVALLQVVAAVLLWRPGRGPAWPVGVTVGLFALVVLQLGWGFTGRLALHVPVGVALLGAQLLLIPGLRRGRPTRTEARTAHD